MALVRLYWLDGNNRIHHPPAEVDCRDDIEALAHGHALLAQGPAGWRIEIWERARRIATLQVPGEEGDAEGADPSRPKRTQTPAWAAGG